MENDISKVTLDISNTKTRTERLHKSQGAVDEEIAAKNTIITKSENVKVRRNAIIERKQNVIDQHNKKLEQMIAAAGVSHMSADCHIFLLSVLVNSGVYLYKLKDFF